MKYRGRESFRHNRFTIRPKATTCLCKNGRQDVDGQPVRKGRKKRWVAKKDDPRPHSTHTGDEIGGEKVFY